MVAENGRCVSGKYMMILSMLGVVLFLSGSALRAACPAGLANSGVAGTLAAVEERQPEGYDFAYHRGKTYFGMPGREIPGALNAAELPEGVTVIEGGEGVQTMWSELDLPEIVSGLFFSRDDRTGDHQWPNNTNRLMPWPFRQIAELTRGDYPGIPSNGKPSRVGDVLLLQLKGGDWMILKAVAGKNSLSCFQVETDGSVRVYVSTLGKDDLPAKVPAFILAKGNTPFEVSRKAYESLISAIPENKTRLRTEKSYEEAFRYLGWCSWEHYHFDIDEQKLLDDLKQIDACDLPVRFVLIDDGHVKNKSRRLTGFSADEEKFPDGWGKIMRMKQPDKIKWMGLWYNFTGYWEGISPDNDFSETTRNSLYPYRETLLPGRDSTRIVQFFQDYLKALKDSGFDFLKIDNQSFMLPLYMGDTEVVGRARNCNIALEEEAHRQGIGLMNCMAQNVVNIDNTRYSGVARVSIDYKKFDRAMAKSHLYQSYVNTLLQGQTVWPDHDMFHSSDSVCGGMMARSKAVSGGPVYLSDAPADFKEELIWPLVDSRGMLFRPRAPAVPFPDELGINPVFGGKAFRVFAPVGDEAMAIVCYNLNDEKTASSVKATISPQDFRWRNALENGKAEEYTEKGMLVYDWERKTGLPLRAPAEMTLQGFTDRLLFLCPVREGWAVVGVEDKYLSPAAVRIVSRTDQKLVLDVLASGTLKVWAEDELGGRMRTVQVECGKTGVKRVTLKR